MTISFCLANAYESTLITKRTAVAPTSLVRHICLRCSKRIHKWQMETFVINEKLLPSDKKKRSADLVFAVRKYKYCATQKRFCVEVCVMISFYVRSD